VEDIIFLLNLLYQHRLGKGTVCGVQIFCELSVGRARFLLGHGEMYGKQKGMAGL
jgi:hypothetical protein